MNTHSLVNKYTAYLLRAEMAWDVVKENKLIILSAGYFLAHFAVWIVRGRPILGL